jgi:hypothetical protein
VILNFGLRICSDGLYLSNQTGSKGLPQMSPDWSIDSARWRAACGYWRFVHEDEIPAATGRHPASLERNSPTPHKSG